ncbi:hypothetical protein [Klebsiella pneumoniae IS10]|nr:hypothetical protein [Klebsiella pneumoniae IS10]
MARFFSRSPDSIDGLAMVSRGQSCSISAASISPFTRL